MGGSTLKLVSGTLAEECKQLFQEWLANPQRKVY